jgi:hypothetical protein
MNASVTVVAPVVKKSSKVVKGKRSRRQARQFEPKVISDMDDFNQQNARLVEIAAQIEQYDDVLFA